MIRGSNHTEESRKKMSKSALKNHNRYWLGKKRPGLNKGNKFSDEIKKRMSESKKGIDLSRLQTPEIVEKRNRNIRRGKIHPMWKGGVTSIYKTIRKSTNYKIWRKSVFERDNYTCQECGLKSGNGKSVELHPDHIKPFSLFPELRFNLFNGRTLCIDCHRKTPTYGGNSLTNKRSYYGQRIHN